MRRKYSILALCLISSILLLLFAISINFYSHTKLIYLNGRSIELKKELDEELKSRIYLLDSINIFKNDKNTNDSILVISENQDIEKKSQNVESNSPRNSKFLLKSDNNLRYKEYKINLKWVYPVDENNNKTFEFDKVKKINIYYDIEGSNNDSLQYYDKDIRFYLYDENGARTDQLEGDIYVRKDSINLCYSIPLKNRISHIMRLDFGFPKRLCRQGGGEKYKIELR